MIKASFSRLEDDSWGVKVQDGVRHKVKSGDEVEVQKRDGEIRQIKLGERVAIWNGRDLIFRIDRKNGNGGSKPKPKQAQVGDIELPDNLTPGQMSSVLVQIHAQLAEHDEYPLRVAFESVSLAASALFQHMQDIDNYS